jgi:c(7)-type cytochrome triheme protein
VAARDIGCLVGACLVVLGLASSPLAAAGPDAGDQRAWRSLAEDRVHDPAAPGTALLQEPEVALRALPGIVAGNQVDWVAALREGHIEPRTNIYPETKINVLDLDVLMKRTANLPVVLFPHRAHTEWLDCTNCHEKIFRSEIGKTPVNMFRILQGEYCGQCHGAVSFPLTQCLRCHSVPRSKLEELEKR